MAADAPLPRVLLLNGLRVSFHYPGDPNRVAVHHQLQHQTYRRAHPPATLTVARGSLLAQTRCVLDAARCQFQVPDAAVPREQHGTRGASCRCGYDGLLQTGSGLVWSTYDQLNTMLQSKYRAADIQAGSGACDWSELPFDQVREEDLNFDGKVDNIYLTARVPLTSSEHIYTVRFMGFFDYKIDVSLPL